MDEHEERTAEFLRLNRELRERHDEDTRRIGETADAVIYLVGQVARVTDQDFLREFSDTTDGRSSALNAVGVLSKIELQPEVMSRRHELAAKISAQLEDGLNTVIPVAAGIRRVLDDFALQDTEPLGRVISALRSIPPEVLDLLLDSEEFFCELDLPECPITPAERSELLGGMKWGVFVTIARTASDSDGDVSDVLARLEEITGFDGLWRILNTHFIERGHLLKCYRTSIDARNALNEIRYTHLPAFRRKSSEERRRRQTFLDFIRDSGGEAEVASELEDFIRENLDSDRKTEALEQIYADLDADLATILTDLTEHNADFEALQSLDASEGLFTEAELAELRPLLGLYGSETEKRVVYGAATPEFVGWRQMFWGRRMADSERGTSEYTVAERAYTRYGLILEELL